MGAPPRFKTNTSDLQTWHSTHSKEFLEKTGSTVICYSISHVFTTTISILPLIFRIGPLEEDTVYSTFYLDNSTTNPTYTVTLTTPRLTELMSRSKMLAGDGTHKVNGERSVLLVIGTNFITNCF